MPRLRGNRGLHQQLCFSLLDKKNVCGETLACAGVLTNSTGRVHSDRAQIVRDPNSFILARCQHARGIQAHMKYTTMMHTIFKD